jgi:ferric-dicitrate binding protein FerR (iron transport regulator)
LKHSPASELEFAERLLRFEDQQFQDADLEAFAEELRRDPEKRERLIRHLRIAQGLRATGERQSAEQALRDRLQVELPPPTALKAQPQLPKLPLIQRSAVPSRNRALEFGKSVLRLAAVLVVGAAGVWIVLEFQEHRTGPDSYPPLVRSEKGSEPDAVTPAEGPLPESGTKSLVDPAVPMVVLGSVSEVEEVNGLWEPGVDITAGEHFLETGTMEFRLKSGVRVLVVGPTRFAALSGDHLRLISGRLSAEVPSPAVGFQVDANTVKVIDHGTRFGVTANTKGDTAVHVYEGSVAAGTGGVGKEPLLLNTGDTVRLNLQTGGMDSVAFEANLFAPKPAWKGGIEWHSRGVEVLESAPREVEEHSFPPDRIVVFRERAGEVLNRDLPVNLDQPGKARLRQGDERAVIPMGRKISSYFLHKSGIVDGSSPVVQVRFDSPVLGIIFDNDILEETDRLLGSRRTDYPSDKLRGTEKGDRVTWNEDGRTIGFHVTGDWIDQIRIIVAED